jgi:molybdenum cofactor biosynthesis enzyme
VDRDVRIESIRLIEKAGGTRGDWQADVATSKER